MTQDTSKPWLPSAVPDSPVDRKEETWFKSSLYWFGRQFGTGSLYRDPILPTAEFLSDVNDSVSHGQIEKLVTHLCGLMMVDPALVEVELFDGSAKKKEAAKRTVGHFRVKDGRAIIALDQSEFSNPVTLTAIAVHELCHLRLQGEGRIRRGAPDGERLTDLLTVYFGFGIFTTNAAMSFARANRAWTIVSRGQLDDRALNGATRHDGYRRLGYLRSAEFGYALACYCWLRREETLPAWTKYLNPGPYVSLEQGLAYLKRTGRTGELPPSNTVRRGQR